MPLVSQTTSYKGFTIAPTWKGWKAVDADGDMVFIGRTKSSVKGGISAIVNGDAWMIEELRAAGYTKI